LRNEALREDGDGRFTVVNTEFERISGRPRGEILGRRGDQIELGVGGRRFSAHDGPEVLEPGGTELFEEVLDGRTYYLKHLPFDYLKIDGEFVANRVRNQTDRLVIAAVVDIARGMGKKTIADFAGTPGPLAALSGPAPRT
jgi:PAS domain-containing protein